MSLNCAFFSIVTLLKLFECSDWNYQGLGPDVWIHEYPSCSGQLQSPINIEHTKAVYDSKLAHINFYNYEQLLFWNVSNNGHTVIASQIYNQSLTPYITGSDFDPNVKYYLKQFHFHWGFNIYQGSEHHVNDQKFPLEVHLVHVSNTSETTVIAFLFQIDEKDNQNLEPLMQEVGLDLTEADFHIIKFSLKSMVPDPEELKVDGFYRYMGSLTTPPCTEGVKWNVFRKKINVSEAQMEQFYKNEIEFNSRDVQQLHNRSLTISIPSYKPAPASTQLNDSIITLILNLLSLLFKLLAIISS
ncbi:unnamed protein product [Brachionus calyciflorus]|uniref:Carbonic anhydrase n=1 Tax=Brachionus calyciflorus TaxID=104777 RepID=A0A813Z3K2_9BILA|nr:unnamed protein product [Brachionus calyciflorus]